MITISKKLMAVIAIATLSLGSLTACSSGGEPGSSGSGWGKGKESHRLDNGEMDPKQEPLENDIYNIIKSDMYEIVTCDDRIHIDVKITGGNGDIKIYWNWNNRSRKLYVSDVTVHGEEAFLADLKQKLASEYHADGIGTRAEALAAEANCNSYQDVASMVAKQLTPIMQEIYQHYDEVGVGYIEIGTSEGNHEDSDFDGYLEY